MSEPKPTYTTDTSDKHYLLRDGAVVAEVDDWRTAAALCDTLNGLPKRGVWITEEQAEAVRLRLTDLLDLTTPRDGWTTSAQGTQRLIDDISEQLENEP